MSHGHNDILVRENLRGVVKKYLADRGFGFIRAYDKTVEVDVYVHYDQITRPVGVPIDERLKLHQCQEVTFDLYSTTKGLVAKNLVMGEILVDMLIEKVNNETNFNC